eukprot:6491520-Amphidinium_carterae.2
MAARRSLFPMRLLVDEDQVQWIQAQVLQVRQHLLERREQDRRRVVNGHMTHLHGLGCTGNTATLIQNKHGAAVPIQTCSRCSMRKLRTTPTICSVFSVWTGRRARTAPHVDVCMHVHVPYDYPS